MLLFALVLSTLHHQIVPFPLLKQFCIGFFSFLSVFSFRSLFSSFCSIPLVIKAYDIDAGLNSHLHYDIVETMPRRYFHIDSTTGAIKTVMLLDHEKIPLFAFHVKVRKMLSLHHLNSFSNFIPFFVPAQPYSINILLPHFMFIPKICSLTFILFLCLVLNFFFLLSFLSLVEFFSHPFRAAAKNKKYVVVHTLFFYRNCRFTLIKAITFKTVHEARLHSKIYFTFCSQIFRNVVE